MKEESIDVAVEISKDIELRISDVAGKCGLGMDQMAREILVLGKELQCAADMSMRRELAALREKNAELQRQLDQAAKQEPYGWIPAESDFSKARESGWPCTNNICSHHTVPNGYTKPLYVLPPNIHAIIEQAKAEERERCFKIAEEHFLSEAGKRALLAKL